MSFPKDIRNADGASVYVPQSAIAIAPNDGADLPQPVRVLTALVGGAVKVTTVGDDTVIIHVSPGQQFMLWIKKVHATDTEATGLVGLI